MSSISSLTQRTSTLLSSNQALDRLQTTQRALADLQEQIATGNVVNRPSDDPSQTSSVLYLRRKLQEREQETKNLDAAKQTLNTADSVLGEATNILIEAQTLASSQIGVGSDAETREAESLVVEAQIQALVDLANTQFNGVSVFGGNNGAVANGLIFEEYLGGVRYTGSDQNLQTDVGSFQAQDFTSLGLTAFGDFEARVGTDVDLDPQVTSSTRLSEIQGNTNRGFVTGAISVTVNGSSVTVDLATADTLDDVATLVNDAITTAAPGAGSLTFTTTGFSLTGNGGNTVAIDDLTNSRTADSLGLDGLSSTGGVAVNSADLNPSLTPQTALASLNAALDLASGFQITQAGQTVTIDTSTAVTIQDLQNQIDDLDLGLRLDIDESGSGLDLVSEVAGVTLSVGENGGTTASDLGIRSFDTATRLTDFRYGVGVVTVEGEDDVQVSLHDGTSFNVNLDSAVTVSDAITLLQTAATTAGVAAGDFTIALATTGNGLVVTDNTVGAGDFAVSNLNGSHAAEHLGISSNVGAGTTITGEDNAMGRVENAFTHLINLRNSLELNDESGITVAGENIAGDINSVVSARAVVGVQAQRLEETSLRAEDQKLQEQSVLSSLQEADLTEVITKYQQMQLQLQATLQTSAQIQQLSLLDFLR